MLCNCRYGTLCIRENPGCLFIATNRDAVTHLTDAQEWAGILLSSPSPTLRMDNSIFWNVLLVGLCVNSSEDKFILAAPPGVLDMFLCTFWSYLEWMIWYQMLFSHAAIISRRHDISIILSVLRVFRIITVFAFIAHHTELYGVCASVFLMLFQILKCSLHFQVVVPWLVLFRDLLSVSHWLWESPRHLWWTT